MNRSFELERDTTEVAKPAVKLFTQSSSDPRREIKRHIILFNDDLAETDRFNWAHSNCRQSLAAHMLNEFLSRWTDPESLVAWYNVIDVASWLLSISPVMTKGISVYERLGSAVLQEKDMRDVLSKITLEDLEVGLSSQSSIESFLVGERARSPGGLKSVRNRLQFATDKYFGGEFHFPSELVRRTVARIGRIDDSILDEHEDWIRTSPNYFQKAWFQYFANLRTAASLDLFSPA